MNTGEEWKIQVNSHIVVIPGANVTIPCTFTYPSRIQGNDIQVYWKKLRQSPIKTPDRDLNAFVFHPMKEYVIKQYRGKTRLYGNPQERNCSLKIDNVQNSDVFYVRVLVNRTFFNFINDKVRIDVTGKIL